MDEVITRPDGKPYRPRKVTAYLVGEEFQTVLVLGTHDIARAQALADELVYSDIDSGCVAAAPRAGWFREGYEHGQRCWVNDAAHGRAGIYFEAITEGAFNG